MAYNSQFYEASGYYGKASVAEYRINPGIRAKFDTLYRHLAWQTGTSFTHSLDIGCGGSPFTRLLSCGQRVFVDLSLVALRGLTRESPLQADLAHLPFRPSTFQVIVGTDVLEHLPRDDLATQELGRVATQNAVLLLTVPHNPTLWSSSDHYEGHFRRYSVGSLSKCVSLGGFKVQSLFKVYGVYWIMRAVQARDRKKKVPERNSPTSNKPHDKSAAEFVLSDIVNFLRTLTRNKFFLAIYTPLALLISRLIMLDAHLLPLSKVSEIGIVAHKATR
jgi:SAM-dependent methyltransferase